MARDMAVLQPYLDEVNVFTENRESRLRLRAEEEQRRAEDAKQREEARRRRREQRKGADAL